MHWYMLLLVHSVARQASRATVCKAPPPLPRARESGPGVPSSAACTGAAANCLDRTGRGLTGARGAPAKSASQTACRLACQERSGGPAAGASLAYDESAGTNSASGSGAPRAASVAVSGRSSRRGSRSCVRTGSLSGPLAPIPYLAV